MNRTDGPWRIGRAISNGQRCIVGDGDSVVAYMPNEADGCTYKPNDARLIAAAPELLEALKLAVRQNSHDMLMTGEELRICAAAIAGATGEQS